MVPGGGQGTRAALRSAGAGEIVEVPGGGRIVRSAAGRKDRHSKVCTAKGTRDRRVRLAAHTAIQFYDVQDRLGYDRPSKAVDWLMKKAKSAIDALDELPTWKPVSKSPDREEETAAAEVYDGNMLPPSMESDSIADTIKSFFPVAGEGSATSTSMGLQSMQFQSFPSSDLLAMRDCNQSQDLKLSLQSLQDPIMIQSHQNNPRHSLQNQEEEEQSQFPGAAHIGFVNQPAGWDDESQQHTDSGRFQRLIGWNLGGYGGGGNGGGGFMFIPPQNSLQQNQMLFSHDSGQNSSHLFTNRESLQSSIITHLPTANSSHHLHHHHHDQSVTIHPMSFPGIGLGSSGGFSGFCIPARIQGDEEDEHNGNPKPFSLSSTSRH